MPLRFEAWPRPGSTTFEKKFDIPVAMPGSAGVRELSNYADESLLLPASYSRLVDLVSETTGSLIRVYSGSYLIDEFDAARVSLVAGRPNTVTVSGPQRNGLVEDIAIPPYGYPNHVAGAMDHVWGGESVLPDLGIGNLGSLREEWEVSTDHTSGQWNADVDGDDVDLDWDAAAREVEGLSESLVPNGTGLQGLSTVDDVAVSGSGTQEVWEVYTDATGGSFEWDFGDGDTATINDGDSAASVASALEGTDAIDNVSVSGSGTSGDPWVITFHYPAAPPSPATDDSGLTGGAGTVTKDVTTDGDPWVITFYAPPDPTSVDFTAGTLSGGNDFTATLITAGATDPSPITKSKPVDAGAGSEEEYGSYDDPPIEVVTTPLDTGGDWTLKINAQARYAGSQIIVDVTPGQTYQNWTVPVYPETAGKYVMVIRDLYENKIAETSPRNVSLSAGSYQDLTVDKISIPPGVNQIVIRVAVTDADPANIDDFYVSWQTASIRVGLAETTYTDILSTLIGEAQDRGAGDWLELDSLTTADSLGTALDDISFTVYAGDNVHLGTVLDQGRGQGYQWQLVPADDALVITPASSTTHVLQVYKVDADEVEDLTASSGGPTVTVGGKGISDAQVVTRRIPYTTLIGLGAGSISAESSNSTAESALGTIERIRDVEHLSSAASVQDYLDAQLAEANVNLKAATATVTENAAQVPLVDYGPGSKIWWQFPGILDKEARPVKRVGWTHGRTATFELQGSRILTADAAVVAAVDMLLRKPGRRRSQKPPASPSQLTGGGAGGQTGAYLHLARSSTQTVSDGGEAISWTLGPAPFARFDAPSFPTDEVQIQQPGYYDLVIRLGIDADTGGKVWVTRTRGGVESTVRPFEDDPDIWESSAGDRFSEVAAAVVCLPGDILKVYFDGQTGSDVDVTSATCSVYLVDRIVNAVNTYRETVLADGPVAYWRLDEPEGTSTATDETGNGRDGTYSAGTDQGVSGLLTGDPDRAAEFSAGSVVPVTVPIDSTLKFLNASFTIEMWIQTTAGQGTNHRAIYWNNDAYSINLISADGGNFCRFDAYRDGSARAATDQLAEAAVGKTVYVVYTYDADTDTCAIWVNGVQHATGSSATTLTDASSDLRIGAGSTNSPNAIIDEVAIYDKVLTSSDINRHYQIGIGGS